MSKLSNIEYQYVNFGPYLMKLKLPNYIIQELKTHGKRAKQDYSPKLAGHLDHQFLYPRPFQQWFYNEIQPIIQTYRKGHCEYHNLEELNVEMSADDLWVNFMKPGDFNPYHTHGGDYSFVIFVDVPKAIEKEMEKFKGTSGKPGSLTFEYTQQARPRWSTTGHNVHPKTGDMYIFPALLGHWVAPFKSKVTRISVSGNLTITNKHTFPPNYF